MLYDKLQKLWSFIKSDEMIYKILFWETTDSDFQRFIDNLDDEYRPLLDKIEWLYIEGTDNYMPVGIYDNKYIVGINEDWIVLPYCIGLQNLHYSLFDKRARFSKSKEALIEKLNDVHKIDYKSLLKKYEDWCVSNSFELNPKSTMESVEEEFYKEIGM